MRQSYLGSCVFTFLFICVTGTSQTSTPKNNEVETTTPVATLHKNTKCYTVDDAAEFCNAYFVDNGCSNERIDNTGSDDDPVDLNKVLSEISEAKSSTSSEIGEDRVSTWRIGSLESQNQYFLNSGRYSDIEFEVGSDNNTQIIHAHKMLLARGSPIFEEILNKTSTNSRKPRYRITDIDASAFKIMLQFIYTGKLCFKIFDKACEMLSIAARFKMPDLAKYCHYYIWLHMYPKNLWSAYQCAVRAKDTSMASAAMDMIMQNTEQAVMDPAFTSIPESTLIEFLRRDSLSVTSELALYEASLRWAMAEATRRDLPQDPESLRLCLGDALKYFRFLTLTPSEFANIQYTSKILSYSESLAVIFNLNAPGVMPLPSNLSSNKNTRKFTKKKGRFTVYKRPSYTPTCEENQLDLIETEKAIFDQITSVFKGNDLYDSIIHSIKIPKPIDVDCSQYEEVSITFLDYNNTNVLHDAKYTLDSCAGNSIVHNIRLNTDVSIPSLSEKRFYVIKIVFHNSGVYPLSLGVGPVVKSQISNRYVYRLDLSYGNQHVTGYETKLGESNFVYSIANYYDANEILNRVRVFSSDL